MQGSRSIFEGSLFMLGCFTGVTLVVLAVNPSVAALQFVWQYGKWPYVLTLAAMVLSARAMHCTRCEFISYCRVVLFVIGALFTLFGVLAGGGNLISSDSLEQTLNSAMVLAVGAGMLVAAWLARRITGVSCIPQLKSMF